MDWISEFQVQVPGMNYMEREEIEQDNNRIKTISRVENDIVYSAHVIDLNNIKGLTFHLHPKISVARTVVTCVIE